VTAEIDIRLMNVLASITPPEHYETLNESDLSKYPFKLSLQLKDKKEVIQEVNKQRKYEKIRTSVPSKVLRNIEASTFLMDFNKQDDDIIPHRKNANLQT
jgi:hypothetical protein